MAYKKSSPIKSSLFEEPKKENKIVAIYIGTLNNERDHLERQIRELANLKLEGVDFLIGTKEDQQGITYELIYPPRPMILNQQQYEEIQLQELEKKIKLEINGES